VKKKDLRRIYCRAIQVLDTSERDNAIRERDLEKKARKKLAYEKAELQLAYDIIKDQLKRLQNEHEKLLRLTQGLPHPIDDPTISNKDLTTHLPPPPPINMRLETVIKIAEVRILFVLFER
jgi:ABC-type phosphate transport system auxiliary subunit